MARHGGGFPLTYRIVERQKAYETIPARGVVPASMPPHRYTRKPPHIPGFRHFLGEPSAKQRFKIDGRDPYSSLKNVRRLHYLMSRLAKLMGKEFDWPVHNALPPGAKPPGKVWENPFLPSGYSYLLQLVGHDLVQTSAPVSILQDTRTGLRNNQNVRLRLDTLYGGGPLVCPFAYALDDKSDETRTKLRLMRIRQQHCPPTRSDPFRDIPRLEAVNLSGVAQGDYAEPGLVPLTDALIADPRNDDHVILSQLTAVFHHLHNALVDMLPARDVLCQADSKWEAAHERYLCARGAVTLIYRNIIRRDLMRLLLHPAIYHAYTVRKPLFLDRRHCVALVANGGGYQHGSRIPLEFSHATFRIGHAMVRDQYDINGPRAFIDTFLLSSATRSTSMPLDETWIVRWSQFFRIKGSEPNLSRRIGPQYSNGFFNIFPAIDQETKQTGLAFRDLVSGGLLGLWSVDAMIERIAASRPEFIKLSPLLSKRRRRVELLKKWLRADVPPLPGKDITTLANNPPLLLFVLLEAAFDSDAPGLRLGVLGSIIAAEVVFGALIDDPLPEEIGTKNLREALAKLSMDIYGKNHFIDVPEIETMSCLIEYTAEIAKLKDAKPPFL